MYTADTIALEEISDFLVKISKYSDGVYWLSTPDFKKIQYISPAYEKIWGRPRAELYSNPELWITYLHPEDAKKSHPIHEMAEKVKKLGLEARYKETYRIIKPTGETRWILDEGAPVASKEGSCCGVTGIAIDVTEQMLEQTEGRVPPSVLEKKASFSPEEFEQTKEMLSSQLFEIFNIVLSRKALECLSFWLSGYSIKESAYCLDLSEKSIEAYRKSIKEKIGVYHKYQLIDLLQEKGGPLFFANITKLVSQRPKKL